ncbi:hypothetical protein PInf_001121 [Phytophthora infestans]|nr:hypothetical protein PInf_023379 [Phytophthora infestans]KAI9991509.1 hypothetical protein PInf_019203 [Phytophthora infestans]KAI9997330.1 hypothetical protein PInf_001121 [Phytophthora infestans]
MPAQLILLFPEDVPQDTRTSLAAPTYAEICDDSEPERVRVRTLAASEEEAQPTLDTWLPRSAAFRRLVWASEPASGGAGNLLWRAVVLQGAGGTTYGQVIEYKGSEVTVRSASGVTSVPASTVEEIAPVIAILLYKAKLTRRAQADISSAHALILDRLLGQNGTTASCSIRYLLNGIVQTATPPRLSDKILWRCPRTGSDVTCSIEHVINYGYYRDGGKAPPASVRLGETFCADPASSPTEGDERQEITSRARTNSGTIDQVPLANLLDTLDQAADLSIPGTDRHEHEEGVDFGNATENDSLRQVSPDVTPRDCNAASAPVRIMSVLANYPDLLETYASQLQQLGPERKRPRVQAISDSVLTTPRYEDGGDRRHNFRPSQGQQAVHDAITAVEHREEFFDAPTRRLITTAKAFSEELNDYAPWSPEEVKAVAFWFSNVLEANRRATEFDISHGTSTRSELPRRFCMQDSELSGMLLKLSRGRDEVARHGKRKLHEPQLETSDRPPYRSNRGNNRQVTSRQVPITVNQAAPRLNGKQLCLRYISAKGCPSKVSDRCTYDFLGHFTPDTLAPVVQEYVVEKYGGLSSEMSSRV